VAALRRESGRRPDDSGVLALVEELRAADQDVARWWDDHTVRDYASVAKRIAHPAAGILSFDIEIVVAPHEPNQRLVVYTAQPDSPTARLLPILASWDISTLASPEPGTSTAQPSSPPGPAKACSSTRAAR
jgi:hypothetical protein